MSRFAAGASLACILFASSGCADAWYAVRGTVGFKEGSETRPLAGATVELSAPPGQAASRGAPCEGMRSRTATSADGGFLVIQHCYGVMRARCAPCVLVVSAPGYERRVTEFRDERSGSRPCPAEEAPYGPSFCRKLDVILEPAAPPPR